MAYLTKQQITDIIQKAPTGMSPEEIIAGLIQQGNQLEGYPVQSITEEHTEGFLQSLAREIVKPWAKTAAAIRSAGHGIYQLGKLGISGMKQVAAGKGTPEQLQRVLSAGEEQKVTLPYVGAYTPPKSGLEAAGYGVEMGTTLAAPMFGKPTTWLEAAKIGAKIGAPMGISKGMQMAGEKNLPPVETAKTIAEQTILGTGFGALTSTALFGLGKGFELLRNKTYETLMRYATNPEKSAEVAAEEGFRGGIKSMLKQIANAIKPKEDEVYARLYSASKYDKTLAGKKYTLLDLIDYGKEQAKKYIPEGQQEFLDIPSEELTDDIYNTLTKLRIKIPEKMNLVQLNELKKIVNQRIFDRTWEKAFTEMTTGQQDMWFLRNSIAGFLKDKVPSLQSIYPDYSGLMGAQDSLQWIERVVERKAPITVPEVFGIFYGATTPELLPAVAETMATRRLLPAVIPSYLGWTFGQIAKKIQILTLPEAQIFLQKLFQSTQTTQ